MKSTIAALLILLSACTGQNSEKISSDKRNADSTANIDPKLQTEITWSGTINNKLPVLLHYSVHEDVIVGEIIYLNTAGRKPIKIIGEIEEDKNYRLLEFEPNGNITGVITGTPDSQLFNGGWFSPKTRKEYEMKLSKKDTAIEGSNVQVNIGDISGTYQYQYGEEGYQGGLDIKKTGDNKFVFDISSVTGAPGHNIAEVSEDSIQLKGNSFIYKIPGTENCEFKVSFYKGFLRINYTKGYCEGQFGLNATVEGIFLKVNE